MPTASDSARTTSVTRFAKRARWSAACPAELAPPLERLLHERELRTQHPGLLIRLLGEATAADAGREAEVVADQRARGGLSADAALVDHERAEPLRGAVYRGREPGGPAADDHEVEVRVFGIDRCAGGIRKLGIGRIDERVPVGQDHEWQLRVAVRTGKQAAPLVRVGKAERVRDRAAAEHLPQLVGAPGPALSNHADRVRSGATIARPLEQE